MVLPGVLELPLFQENLSLFEQSFSYQHAICTGNGVAQIERRAQKQDNSTLILFNLSGHAPPESLLYAVPQ